LAWILQRTEAEPYESRAGVLHYLRRLRESFLLYASAEESERSSVEGISQRYCKEAQRRGEFIFPTKLSDEIQQGNLVMLNALH
jgi:hypothetical protein